MIDLQQFCGGGDYYKHLFGMLYTEGVQYLAEQAGAYWLIDLVASYQKDPRVKNNTRLQEFQLWELKVKDGKGVATLREDSDEPIIIQQVFDTDFPLEEIRLYVEGGVLLLPNEH